MRNKMKSLGKWLSWKENPGPPLPLLVILYAGILIMVLMSVLPALGNPYSTMPVNKLIAALGQYGYVAFASPQGELTVTGDILPSSDCGSSLGSATLRFQKGWFCSSSVLIGDVEISNTGSQLDIDGQLVLHGPGKVWMELQPDLDYATVQAFGKPTLVSYGVHTGFSLPIYNNDNEELFVAMDVPREWDGITNPIVHIHYYLPSANNNKRVALQLAWDAFSPKNNDIVYTNTVTTTTNFACESYSPAYTSYQAKFEINYDQSPTNPVTTCDEIALRLRRVASVSEITGEVVITHIGIQFLRDKLGEVTP